MINDIIIGIDPDIEQSGVARLDIEPRKVWADHLPLPLLLDYILTVKEVARMRGKSLRVVVEASWDTAHNWHGGWKDSKAIAARKGYDVGRNHQTGRLIIELLRHYGIDVDEARPLKKIWQGRDGKITHAEMTQVCGWDKKRSNQEERDAMLLAWNASGLPIRITTK